MNYVHYKTKKILLTRVLVPFWQDKKKRWVRRNRIIADLSEEYLKDMPVSMPEDTEAVRPEKEYIFSMWLQGAPSAPKIVKACWESIRRHSQKELVVLDAESVERWIELPPGFLERWRKGRIKACHVADLCRVELLWKYGGYWMDATDFMCHPVPSFIEKEPFFMYMGDQEWHFFVQNCFIKAYAHHPLIGAWRQSMRLYWATHRRAFDYFLPHRLFRHIVSSDPKAASLFSKMPKICHEPTQLFWRDWRDEPFDKHRFQALTAEGAFQKLEYKSLSSTTPRPGTFADFIVNSSLLEPQQYPSTP